VNVNNPQRIKGGNTYTHFHPVQCRLRHDEVVFKPGRAEHPHQASSRLSKRDYISGQRRWIVELHQQCRGEERRINGAGIKCVETCEQSGLDSQNVQDSIKADVNDAKVETFPQSYQASTSASTTTVFRPSPRLKILNLSLQDRFAVFPCFTAPVDALAQRPADFVDVVAPAVGAVAAMGGLGRARGLLGQPLNGSSLRSSPRSLKLPTIDIPEAVVLLFLTPLSLPSAPGRAEVAVDVSVVS
jgi:hypothetical protein